MSFLKAEWRKLIMINYEVNPDVLQPFLPHGTELDFYDNTCYVSLVGFMFKNTKLMGVKIPFHVNFEEVNLRFYVKRQTEEGGKRGVVFIKEIVPKRAITFIANTVYNENYQTLKMQHRWEVVDNDLSVEYQWKIQKQWQSIAVNAINTPIQIEDHSKTEFIAEHYWGYAKHHQNTTEYEVKHPKWQYYPVKNYNINVDFEKTYGNAFKGLNTKQPNSVMLLEGSEISVENKIDIKD